MRSVADVIRRESLEAVGRLDPIERVTLALALGDADVALYQAAHGISERDARAALSRTRAIQRQASVVNARAQP